MSVLVGKKAPEFSAPAVLSNGSIIEDFSFKNPRLGKYCAIVFYPLDFTFVCPSELISLDKRIETFNSLNVEVLAISVDSHFSHNAWRMTPVNKGGIGQVGYTMVSDINHSICKAYGIEVHDVGVSYRATFLIDRDLIVRHQVVNDLPLGRNMDELVRMVKALQFHETNGQVCPAGWMEGEKGMDASPEGVKEYLSENHSSL